MGAPRSIEDAGGVRLNLARLNSGEREVLELLAKGHTAKSIAVLTEVSEGAVNERLRSARRKTGVGSSRELARLLRDQETWTQANRDGRPGPLTPASSHPAPPEPRTPPSSKGVLLMVLALAAASAAVLLMQGAPASDPAPGSTIPWSRPPLPSACPMLGSCTSS